MSGFGIGAAPGSIHCIAGPWRTPACEQILASLLPRIKNGRGEGLLNESVRPRALATADNDAGGGDYRMGCPFRSFTARGHASQSGFFLQKCLPVQTIKP